MHDKCATLQREVSMSHSLLIIQGPYAYSSFCYMYIHNSLEDIIYKLCTINTVNGYKTPEDIKLANRLENKLEAATVKCLGFLLHCVKNVLVINTPTLFEAIEE